MPPRPVRLNVGRMPVTPLFAAGPANRSAGVGASAKAAIPPRLRRRCRRWIRSACDPAHADCHLSAERRDRRTADTLMLVSRE